MYDLVIFAALGWERRAVTDGLPDVAPAGRPRTWRGRLGDGSSCLVVQTGMGMQRARTAALAVPPARFFLGCGCAGALAEELRTGDLVVASDVISLAEAGSRVMPVLARPLAAWAAERGLPLRTGRIATNPVVLSSAAGKAAAAAGGALVVDMETAALAAVAHARGVPFAALRVVLDEARQPLPLDLDLVDEATGEVRAGRALAALATRPGLWPHLPRLTRQSRQAALALRAFMAELLVGGGVAALGLVSPPALAASS
jgi:adenosylhomocysteine nucleosidase